MIHEEDLTQEQNDFIDATEEWIDNADVRLQRLYAAMAEEGIE